MATKRAELMPGTEYLVAMSLKRHEEAPVGVERERETSVVADRLGREQSYSREQQRNDDSN